MNTTQLRVLSDQFDEIDGRRPRILLGAMGSEADEKSLRLYGACFADAGFDVDVSPIGQCPADTAKMAMENDVHMIALCSAAAGDAQRLQQLRSALDQIERPDIVCFVRAQADEATVAGYLAAGALAVMDGSSDDINADIAQVIDWLFEIYN